MIPETSLKFSVDNSLHRKALTDSLSFFINKVFDEYQSKARQRATDGGVDEAEYAKNVQPHLAKMAMSFDDIVNALVKADAETLAFRESEISGSLNLLLKNLNAIDSYTIYEWKNSVWQVADSFTALATRLVLSQVNEPLPEGHREQAKELLEKGSSTITLDLTKVKPELARLLYITACRGLKKANEDWSDPNTRESLLEYFFPEGDPGLRSQLLEENRGVATLLAQVAKGADELPADEQDLLHRITEELFPSIFTSLSKADAVLVKEEDRARAAAAALAQFNLIREGLTRILDREADAVLAQLLVQTELIRSIALGDETLKQSEAPGETAQPGAQG